MERTIPSVIGGRYRVIRFIGRGAMGEVHEVEHLRTGQRLAAKVLLQTTRTQDSVERFRREARASGRIKSEHVVRVTDADIAPEMNDAPFIIMELLEGTTLESAPKATGAEVLEWLRQISRALDKAHALGIMHRDLKPENLFLTTREDGSPLVKILDFGLAKFIADDVSSTRSGQILGTPLYMSPDQADSADTPISAQSDLFSLGLIAFRLLVGRDYWGVGNTKQILAGLLVEPLALASKRGATFGHAFDVWFAKACAREPADRFATAREQTEALAAALGETVLEDRASVPEARRSSSPTPVPAPSPSLGEAPTLDASVTSAAALLPSKRRPRTPLLMALALAAALGSLVYLLVRERAQPSATASSAALVAAAASSPPPPSPVPLEAAVPVAMSAPAPVVSAPRPLAPPRSAASASARPKPSASVDPLAGQE